jgi:hypothetical protein
MKSFFFLFISVGADIVALDSFEIRYPVIGLTYVQVMY